jgi:hypothetical protein
MEWLTSGLAAAQQAANSLISSEAAEKARALAQEASRQAVALAQEASAKAQVRFGQHGAQGTCRHGRGGAAQRRRELRSALLVQQTAPELRA